MPSPTVRRAQRRVEVLTTTEIEGAPVIVSGGTDRTVAAWTLPEGTPVARMAMVSAEPVLTVAPDARKPAQ
jgi:hypothetical protein